MLLTSQMWQDHAIHCQAGSVTCGSSTSFDHKGSGASAIGKRMLLDYCTVHLVYVL